MAGREPNWTNGLNIFSTFSAKNWQKYTLGTLVLFLIFLWRVTANEVERIQNRNEELNARLQKCNESRTLDAQGREAMSNERAKVLDEYVKEQLKKSADKYFQPKLDSLNKL